LGSKRGFLAAAEVETFSNLDVEEKHLEVACKPIFATMSANIWAKKLLRRL
jgi:hypothetical protein